MTRKKTCRYSEDQIAASGLLSASRLAEVREAVTSRISPARDRNGDQLAHALVVHFDDGTRWLHPCVEADHARAYVRTTALADVLTSEELELVNRHCLEAVRRRQEEEWFAKAVKTGEWAGGVWWRDTFYPSLGELVEALCHEEEPWPEYVWAASPRPVIGRFHAWGVCEGMVCDNGWEDMDASDLEGLAELQAALDRFTEANAGVLSYTPDHKVAVMLAGHGPTEAGCRDERI